MNRRYIGVKLTILASMLVLCLATAEGAARTPSVRNKAPSSSSMNASPKIEDFLLYAERSIVLGREDVAHGGDIGVRTTASSPVSQLTVAADTHVDATHSLIAPSVTLQHEARVGTVQTNVLQNNGGNLTGNTSFPTLAMPALPLGRVLSIGSTDVTVGRDKKLSLAPGSYGALNIQGTLLLTSGNYSFSQVTLESHARMRALTSGVRVDVAKTIIVGHEASVRPASGRPAGDLIITVAGTDGTQGQYAAALGSESEVRAILAVPHGTLAFANDVDAIGAFAGFDIVVGKEVKLKFQSGLPVSDTLQHGQQQLSGYFTVPADSSTTPLVGSVPLTTTVHLAIGLPVRDPTGLDSLAAQVSDPKSPKYRQYFTVDQFAQTFGAPATDYQALVNWAQSTGLTVDSTYGNNLLVSISGTAAQIEEALYTNLVYRLRSDGSTFITIDREPSIDFNVPLLRISGLNDIIPDEPMSRRIESVQSSQNNPRPDPGSGPGGLFGGNDFRAAYAPGVSLTGTGQTVAIYAKDGFFANDIALYENLFNLPNVPVQTQLLNGFNGLPDTKDSKRKGREEEVALDIEMAIAMAPGLNAVIVYEGTQANSILGAIAAPPTGIPLSRQVSSSWSSNIDDNTRQILAEFAVQGQSFFQASGDSGAFPSDPGGFRDLPYTTLVGGTVLSMNGLGSSWNSETTWPDSGGGIMTNTLIPDYQKNLDFSRSGGSTQFRNAPDVSMIASDVVTYADNGSQLGNVGTSIAAPLWAGYMALVNEQAQNNGKGVVGFANPLFYSIGQSVIEYPDDFHDIKDGSSNPSTITTTAGLPVAQFSAVVGYDLATGWGTPTANLINDLSGVPSITHSAVTIRYHQVGACNGYPTDTGFVSTGSNAAYVIFGIESIDNSQSTAPFTFDPSKLYVQLAQQDFIDPNLLLVRDILGPFAAIVVTVNPGQDLKYSTNAYGALVAPTANSNGAVEANQTPYFLRYSPSPSDPRVELDKTDSTRTSWPLTENCKDIVLQ